MTRAFKFEFGNLVETVGRNRFTVQGIQRDEGGNAYYSPATIGDEQKWFAESYLTLVPARPPYVSSPRKMIYRAETDNEMHTRHWAEYENYKAAGDGL